METLSQTPESWYELAPSAGSQSEPELQLMKLQLEVQSQRQQLHEARALLEHRDRQIAAMRQISDTLFTHLAVDDMLRDTLSIAIKLLDADAGSFLVHNPADDTLTFRHVIGPIADQVTGMVIPASAGIAGRVFHSGVPLLVDDTRAYPEQAKVEEMVGYHAESMLSVPVRCAHGKILGTLQILSSVHRFDPRDLEVLEVLSAVAAASIENARLAQTARQATLVHVIGDVSHDIKNLLTPIQSGVWTLEPMLEEMFVAVERLCREQPAAPDLGERITTAMAGARNEYGWMLSAFLDAVERVQSRTKEIADAVKGESAPPQFAPTDLNELVREVLGALHLTAASAGVTLNLALDAALPPVDCDRQQLYNALYNLVNNAIPETPPGGSVTVHTGLATTAPDLCLIQVQDTGRGIPEAVRARLFTDEAISTKPGGTGLGTRIVADVVRRHHGLITVDTEPGHGSVFTMHLPLRQAV